MVLCDVVVVFDVCGCYVLQSLVMLRVLVWFAVVVCRRLLSLSCVIGGGGCCCCCLLRLVAGAVAAMCR